MNSISFAGGFALALALPGFAAAAPASVPYGDLDFSGPNDVAAFNARVDAAAKKACAGNNTVQLDGNRRVTCRQTVRDRVIASLPEAQRMALSGAKPAPTQRAAR